MNEDPLLADLAGLDPAVERPPAPGSSRYDSILERAMTATDLPNTDLPNTDLPNTDLPNATAAAVGLNPEAPSTGAPPQTRRGRGRRSIAAAIAVAAAIVAGVVLLQPGRDPLTPTPAAALTDAADRMGDVTSFRATATMVDRGEGSDPTPIVYEVEVSGDAARLTIRRLDPATGEPTAEAPTVHTVIGLDEWIQAEGEVSHQRLTEDDTNLPYASSSAAVIRAALKSGQIEDLGNATIGGDETTHYRITLDGPSRAALAGLSPRVVAQFELEYPQSVSTIDIWVADDLIRRIEVEADYRQTVIGFSDFGADLDIQPPA